MALPPEIEAKLIELGRGPGEGDGYQIEMALEYDCGFVPSGCPERVMLTAPPATEVWKICAHVKAEDCDVRFLFYCLPDGLKECLFFHLLTKSCQIELVLQGRELVMGERLAHYFQATARRLYEEDARERQSNPR